MTNIFNRISRREQRALGVLTALFLAGHLLRALAASPAAPPAAAALFDPAGDGNPLAHRDSIHQQERPLGPNERIDVEHASAAELTRLPGIGPALANRIVADRQSHGAFGTIAGLRRVRGVGAALLERLRGHLSFGGVPAEAQMTSLPDLVDVNLATVTDLVGLPGIGLARARAVVAFRDSAGPFRQIEDLKRVPGFPASLLRQLAGRLVVP
jgi:competence ComEA-like helix-hairpin-helix protein